MSKVYLVILEYKSYPVAVFTEEAAAQAYKARLLEKFPDDSFNVLGFDLDPTELPDE